MIPSLSRRACAAAAFALLADGAAAAQSEPARLLVSPQLGNVVSHSSGGTENVFISFTAELPVVHGVALAAEWSMPFGRSRDPVCLAQPDECPPFVELGSGLAAGVIVRAVDLSRIQPYAGLVAGLTRWSGEHDSGTSSAASLRAGADLRVSRVLGVRGDFTRRLVWTGATENEPLRLNLLSLGLAIAVRR